MGVEQEHMSMFDKYKGQGSNICYVYIAMS